MHLIRRIFSCTPILLLWLALHAHSQVGLNAPQSADEIDDEMVTPTRDTTIRVNQDVPDEAISSRILNILMTSGWFVDPAVEVNQGIAVLSGVARSPEHKEWAGQIARRTEQVVAVINHIEVDTGDPWDLQPAFRQVQDFSESMVRKLPVFLVSALVLLLFLFIARRASLFISARLASRIDSVILRQLIARLAVIPLVVLGIYLVLNITGLGGMAATLIGGTGLLGLIIGIAFRDITENFLASILISIQRPFRLGDLIRIQEYQGFVEAVTTRGTVLMTLEGNHVQIPNSTIYKETIINYTANPTVRLDFEVGIGYDTKISYAQSVAMAVFADHPVVLKDPEPMVLAEALGAATVTLHLYFWVDITSTSILKARSSLIRLIKHSFMEKGISMPDEARELIFPQGIRVSVDGSDKAPEMGVTEGYESSAQRSNIEGEGTPVRRDREKALSTGDADDSDAVIATPSEGHLTSETPAIRRQARNGCLGGNEVNLIKEK